MCHPSIPCRVLALMIVACGVAAMPLSAQITDPNGYITSDNWLAVGPFANPFGCSGSNGDIATLHVAPSLIQCQYPEEGDELAYDPSISSTDGLLAGAPRDAGTGNPLWYFFDDGSPDCDLNMDGQFGDVTDHNLYVATYVEYTGDTPIDIEICANSDDGLQVWFDDQLVINNNACRGRGACATNVCDDVGTVTVTPGCHRIIMGVWERAGGFGGSLRLQEAGFPIVDDPVASPDWIFHGVGSCGDAPATCDELALRTVEPFDCPTDEITVTIRQPVPTGANPAEVITVVERISGELGAADVTASNGGSVMPLVQTGDPVGEFADHLNIVLNPTCTPSNGDTVEGPPGTYTLTNTGEDIWQNGDTFQFAYNCVEGDFDVSVHIVDRTPSTGSRWGKHGLMARQNLDPRSRYSWTHDAVGDIATAAQNNDDSTRHASRPNHLAAGNFEQTVFATNPGGDGVDDYCDGEGPDNGPSCATGCPDTRGAGCVVHDDYLRLVRTGSLFESYSRADPADPWTFLGSHDWGAGAPDTVLVGLAATSHSTDCASMIEIVFDQVDFGDADIVPCGDPRVGAIIEWNVTRQQLANGISYTASIVPGAVGFDGTAGGQPISGPSTTQEVCPPMTNPAGTFLPRAFLAYGPFQPTGQQIPCGGAPDELLANFISPEQITCFAPVAGDEPGWDLDWHPELGVPGTYLGPTGPGGEPVVRPYGGTLPDLNSQFGGDDRAIWLITYIENTSGSAVDAEFCLSTDDGAALVVDDEIVHLNNVCRGVAAPCAGDFVPVTLSPGPHVIKAAAFNRGGGWSLDLVLRVGGVPVVHGDPGWIFHGRNRPGDASDYPCSDLPIQILPIASATCTENGAGGIDVTWANPGGPAAQIDVSVNGVLVDTLPSGTTSYTVDPGDIAGADVASVCLQPQGALSPACCAIAFSDEVYINCGGPEFVDPLGRVWTSDLLGAPSGFLTSPDMQSAAMAAPVDLFSDPHVADAEYPPEVFMNERWNDGPIEYTIKGLDPGTYDVALLFMEHCCSEGCLDAEVDPLAAACDAVSEDDSIPIIDPQSASSTCRVFDILINGAVVRDQFSKNVLAACVSGNAPGVASFLIGVSVLTENVQPVGGAITVRIEDQGAGNPPENASIKGICITPSGGPPVTVFKRGDADAVGVINITDGVFLLNFLFLGGPQPPCMDAADANDGGTPNITTAVFLFNFLFLGGPSPPPPGNMNCGSDPTPDALDCASYDNC